MKLYKGTCVIDLWWHARTVAYFAGKSGKTLRQSDAVDLASRLASARNNAAMHFGAVFAEIKTWKKLRPAEETKITKWVQFYLFPAPPSRKVA